jgi:formate hydrogenlyase subunit 6/NADH:ubiquinone oxidoreductase subunit I
VFDLIRKIWQTKTVTKTILFDEAPSRFRGKPVFSANECSGCGSCETACPANAIKLFKDQDSINLSLSYTNCIFCGLCTEVCETKMIQGTNDYRLATKEKESLTITRKIPVKTSELLTAGNGG